MVSQLQNSPLSHGLPEDLLSFTSTRPGPEHSRAGAIPLPPEHGACTSGGTERRSLDRGESGVTGSLVLCCPLGSLLGGNEGARLGQVQTKRHELAETVNYLKAPTVAVFTRCP